MTTNIDDAFSRVHAARAAQSVWNDLEELEGKRTVKRWIWELLQNAHDASTSADNSIIAQIKYKQGKLVFLHNGRSFKADEVAHLIWSGTTKAEDKETYGQYGTGFLTTHLLSLKIDVSGRFENGQWFDFTITRNRYSREALLESMSQAEEDFKNSLSDQKPLIPAPFTTQFIYPIEDDAVDAVHAGIDMLKQCAPLVVIFNQKFCRIEIDIDIKGHHEKLCFKALERVPLDEGQIQQITVAEGNSKARKYLQVGNEKTSVTIPLKSNSNCAEFLPIGEIPRLFYGLPLVGTEFFSFPAIINSFKFSTIPDRDGVPLRESTNEKYHTNQDVIEEACTLLVHMLGYAASAGWHRAYLLAEVPTIPEGKNWLDPNWLRRYIKEKLIDEIRQTLATVTEAGQAIAPKDAALPLAENIQDLWDLLEGLKGQREKLPRREEAAGWYNAIKSWATISGKEPESLFSETMDGRKLASYIDEKTRCGKIENLQGLLREDVPAVEWLNQLHNFLFNEDGLRDVMREYHIVIDQGGFLDQLSNLYCDRGIDEELKNIAGLLEWPSRECPIRQKLRDIRLTSLAGEVGLGNWESKDIIGNLINELRKRVDNKPDDNFKEASARLFAWIVDQDDWNRLQGFPTFTKEGNSVRDLSTARGGKPLLAPVHAWQEDLKQFADLFPPDCILADDFKVCAPEAWEQLDKQDLIRKSMIITRNETDLKTLSPYVDQEGSHETTSCITVTDIVEREAIMRRVRDSQDRAFLFWRFLTEWFIKEHGQDLEIQEALCTCKETHKYYLAAWLMPVRKNEWIRLEGNRRRVPDAQSLASLLRGRGWALNENHDAVKPLLEAIGVNLPDLRLGIITENEEERNELVNSMTELHHVTQGNLDQIYALVQDMKYDEKFFDDLEKRRKQRKRVHENQGLGRQVEKLVKESLEGENFAVKRKPIGSDFEIEQDSVENDKEMGIELAQGNQSWLVEVKATRIKEVRMTSTQAKTAVEKKSRFLLCVVPLDPEGTDPDLDTVRTKMRFVKDIGTLIDRLCDDLDGLEECRKEITASTSSGVQLDVVPGTARIRVASSVWENDGFPLENLAEQLK